MYWILTAILVVIMGYTIFNDKIIASRTKVIFSISCLALIIGMILTYSQYTSLSDVTYDTGLIFTIIGSTESHIQHKHHFLKNNSK